MADEPTSEVTTVAAPLRPVNVGELPPVVSLAQPPPGMEEAFEGAIGDNRPVTFTVTPLTGASLD